MKVWKVPLMIRRRVYLDSYTEHRTYAVVAANTKREAIKLAVKEANDTEWSDNYSIRADRKKCRIYTKNDYRERQHDMECFISLLETFEDERITKECKEEVIRLFREIWDSEDRRLLEVTGW